MLIYMHRIFVAWISALILLVCVENAQAATYYLSPSGNDSNAGSTSAPWQTIQHAVDTVAPGDTIILKSGTYAGYVGIDVANTTWKTETQNKHLAVIDGGFSPSLLQGTWDRLFEVWNSTCSARGKFSNLLSIESDNVVIDGLFLRNSCGRGILIRDDVADAIIQNNRIDWTFIAGLYTNGASSNVQILNNDLTRISFDDIYSTSQDPEDYGVNISIHMSGENPTVRGNLIAWGRGEIAMTGSRNLLFEKNIVIGNKNSFYNGWADGVIVRNNLFWSPESKSNQNTHWHKYTGNDNDWHISSRNENDDRWVSYASGMNNIAYYNNLIINNAFSFEGYHKTFSTDTTQVYFGHNTLVAGTEIAKLFDLSFQAKDASDSKITGIFENNIFDTTKNPSAIIKAALSTNDQVTFRNNVMPNNAGNSVRGSGDLYTDNPRLVNALVRLDFQIPAIGAATVDTNALRNAVNINNYRLSSASPAINAGTTAGMANGTQIPSLARSKDYVPVNRLGIPDLGAFEYIETNDPTSAPDSPTDGDLTGDGIVNLQDHALAVSKFNNPYTLLDYNAVITNYQP